MPPKTATTPAAKPTPAVATAATAAPATVAIASRHVAENRRSSSHVGTALLLLATCLRSIAPMDGMMPGSDVGFTTRSHTTSGPQQYHHHHHQGGGGSSSHSGPNAAEAYTLLGGLGGGAVPHIDSRRGPAPFTASRVHRAAGACGTDADFTTASTRANKAGGGSTGGQSADPPRVRSNYRSFGPGGEGSGSGAAPMTDDAVGFGSDDEDDEEELRRLRRRAAAAVATANGRSSTASRAHHAPAPASDESDPDALSIASSGPSLTAADLLDVASSSTTTTTAEAGARSALTAVIMAATATFNAPAADEQEEVEIADSLRRGLDALPSECLDHALANLPLSDIAQARHACAALAAAADRVAPRPIAGGPTFVRWTPQALRTKSLDTTAATIAATIGDDGATKTTRSRRGGAKNRAAKQQQGGKAAPSVAATVPFHWRCLACSATTNGNKTCGECGSDSSMTACRVFVGQLRKQQTAELLSHLIGLVCPTATVLHIESHTNGHTGRSKGCAWVYLNGTSDAVALTAALHKRAFVDVDADGNEGVWYLDDATDSAEAKGHLAAFAAERVETATAEAPATAEEEQHRPVVVVGLGVRCPQVMPRQPIVAELPGTSLLAELALEAFNA